MRPKFSGCSFRKGSGHTHPVTIGSLEGNGQATLGTRTLYVGSNDLSATFSGVIQREGSVIKIGTGTLTLSGANTYAGPSSVTAGTLVADNVIGSATGTGPVQVEAGTLGGSGTVAGAVTIGTGNGSGTGAFLAPAHGGNEQLTLSIEGSLTFNVDATYTYTFKAKRKQAKADKVVANGVTISSSASTNLSGQTQGTLTQGLVLTVICNTAATPISGTFSNLPDGAIATVNGNNFQANYEGGDGNDLTQTVVP
jgi:autotransporter-associated beta strand protein